MTANEDVLRLPSSSVTSVLQRWEAQQQRRRQGSREAPLQVTLLLSGGQTLQGEFVGLSEADEAATVVLALQDRGGQDVTLTYVWASALLAVSQQVDAMSLHGMAVAPRPTDSTPVTRLSLERRLSAMGGGSVWQGVWRWADFDQIELNLAALRDVLDDLDAALEPMPQALSLRGITIEGAPGLAARVVENVLHVTVPTESARVIPPTRLALKRALEKALQGE